MRNPKRQNAPKAPKPTLLPRESLEILERGELLFSGVSGIEGYSPDCVRVRTAKGTVAVSGRCLSLCWAGEKRLLLRGRIETVCFL